MAKPVIMPAQIEKLVPLLRVKLRHGRPDLRQARARSLLDEARVTDRENRTNGSKAVLARSVAKGVAKTTLPFFCSEMARSKGFEPLTPRFVVWCSIQLSYERAARSERRNRAALRRRACL